jgi:putative FmdB family regulatory protein
MPTYDYRCRGCSHELEHFQSMTAAPLTTCPECAEPELERLIGTGAGLLFKGSGYYQTDYRSESYRKDAKADKESSSGAGTDSSADKSKGNASPKKDGSATGGGSSTASSKTSDS